MLTYYIYILFINKRILLINKGFYSKKNTEILNNSKPSKILLKLINKLYLHKLFSQHKTMIKISSQ